METEIKLGEDKAHPLPGSRELRTTNSFTLSDTLKVANISQRFILSKDFGLKG